jgi:hypothetical protein
MYCEIDNFHKLPYNQLKGLSLLYNKKSHLMFILQEKMTTVKNPLVSMNQEMKYLNHTMHSNIEHPIAGLIVCGNLTFAL